MQTREEYIEYYKTESFKRIDEGKPLEAFWAFQTIMQKNPITKNHPKYRNGFHDSMNILDSLKNIKEYIESF